MSINVPHEAVQRKFEEWLGPTNRFVSPPQSLRPDGAPPLAYYPPDKAALVTLVNTLHEAQAPLRLVGVYGDHLEGVPVDLSHFNEFGLFHEQAMTLPLEFGTQFGPVEQFLGELGLGLGFEAPKRARFGAMFFNGCFVVDHIAFAVPKHALQAMRLAHTAHTQRRGTGAEFAQLAQDDVTNQFLAQVRPAPTSGVWIEATFEGKFNPSLWPHLDTTLFDIRHAFGIMQPNEFRLILHCEGDAVNMDDFERHWQACFILQGAKQIRIERHAQDIKAALNAFWHIGRDMSSQFEEVVASSLLSWHDFPNFSGTVWPNSLWIMDFLNQKLTHVHSPKHGNTQVQYRSIYKNLHNKGLFNPLDTAPSW